MRDKLKVFLGLRVTPRAVSGLKVNGKSVKDKTAILVSLLLLDIYMVMVRRI